MKHVPFLLMCLGMILPAFAFSQAPSVGTRLGRMQVRQIAFRDAEVVDVIEQLAVIARESDPPVNIVMANPNVQRPKINLELRNQSMRDILILVCKVAKLQIEVRNGIVFIVEPEE